MLSKTGFTHSDLLRWQIDYAGWSLNVNGTIMRDGYTGISLRNAVAFIVEKYELVRTDRNGFTIMEHSAVSTFFVHAGPADWWNVRVINPSAISLLTTFARSDIYDNDPSPTRKICFCSPYITLHSPNPITRTSPSNAGVFLFVHKHSYSYSRY